MGNADGPRQLAYVKARELALSLWSYSTAGYAKSWTAFLGEKIIDDAIVFSVHARRVNQLFEIDTQRMEMHDGRKKYSTSPTEPFENNYGRALNQLVHSADLSLHWTEAAHRNLFNDGPTYFAGSIVACTDKYPNKAIDLRSISSTYLVHIRSLLSPA